MAGDRYVPDDAQWAVATLDYLATSEGARLRAAVAQLPDPAAPAVTEVARLRKLFPAEAVRAALSMGGIQAKGRIKFPGLSYVWSPPEALEQATASVVARHKAGRFAAARGEAAMPVFDLCCGIGGDAMALAGVAPVIAVDLSAVRLACLRCNIAERPTPFPIVTREVDVQAMLEDIPPDARVHVDPARRAAGRRSPRFEEMQPGPEVLRALIKRVAGVAIKLSPAVDFDSLPPGHLELISHGGSVVQAVLWTGTLAFAAEGQRTATVISETGDAWSFTAVPLEVEQVGMIGEAGGTLYEVDGALTRARLAGPFAKGTLIPLTLDGGYGVSRRDDLSSRFPCLTGFRILRVERFSEERVGRVLEDLSTGDEPARMEVKSRGRLPGVETDHLQVAWARRARGRFTVLLYRQGEEVFAAVCRRL